MPWLVCIPGAPALFWREMVGEWIWGRGGGGVRGLGGEKGGGGNWSEYIISKKTKKFKNNK